LIEEYAVYNTLSKFKYDIVDITYKADGSFDVEYNLLKIQEKIKDRYGTQYLYLFIGTISFIESVSSPYIHYFKNTRFLNLFTSSIEKNIRFS